MGYPVAYRNSAARQARQLGSQGVDLGFVPREVGAPARNLLPANDRKAANYTRSLVKQFVEAAPRRGYARAFARNVGRAVPLVGGALIAYELYNFWRNQDIVGAYQVMAPGWDLDADCGGPTGYTSFHEDFPFCSTWVVGGPNAGTPRGNSVVFTEWGTDASPYLQTPFEVRSSVRRWIWHGGIPVNEPQFGTPIVPVAPSSFPNWSPASRPVSEPAHQNWVGPQVPWAAVPYHSPNPWEPPEVQHQAGYTDPVSNPGGSKAPKGGVEIVPGEGVKPDPAARHRREPPGPRNKERKFILNPTTANLLYRLYNAATELDDFVDDLYWAVEVKKRPKGRLGIHEKARFIYQHADKLNFEKAVRNYLNDQWKDYVYGQLGRQTAKATRRIHDTGLGTRAVGYGVSRRTGYGQGLPIPDLF